MPKRFGKKRIASLLIFILIAIEIFWFSSLPGGGGGGVGGSWPSRIYHFTIFFLLNFFLLASIKPGKKLKFKQIMLALFLSLIYAILDEVHQMFVPFRGPGVSDVLTDTAGIFFSILVSFMFAKKVKKS